MKEWPPDAQSWFEEALWDYETAMDLLKSKRYNHVCFHSQQSAEKALKALLRAMNESSWGHSVRKLLDQYNEKNDDQLDLIIEANDLDRHYIPSRYPDALPSKRIIAFVRQKRDLITEGDENE